MASDDDGEEITQKTSHETSAPARNFSIALEDRVRALGGPPAYVRRKRWIEDLEEAMVKELRALAHDEAKMRARAERFDLTKINALVDKHNAYYPSEAELPLDPLTGAMLERGKPWRALARVTVDALIGRAKG